MSLLYNKYPGEWHGPGSISNVMKDLNKLYQPVEDFQIVHFNDGMLYYDKILKAARAEPRKYLFHQLNRQDLNRDRIDKLQAMHLLFKRYAIDDNNSYGVDQVENAIDEEFKGDVLLDDADDFFDSS